ncbi:hypothetical protein LCM16_02385 [Mameliella alba]|nr:hypothetical protein [Mameliella alba]
MGSWVEAGQDPAQFWHLTLREIGIVLDGAARRLARERDQAEVQAWQTARLVMIGYHQPRKFPPFKKVSSSAPSRRRGTGARPSWQDQKALIQVINAAFGGEVRKRDG